MNEAERTDTGDTTRHSGCGCSPDAPPRTTAKTAQASGCCGGHGAHTGTLEKVRDPVCGIHLTEGLALPLRQGSETVYFCSAECREKYQDGMKKFAANG